MLDNPQIDPGVLSNHISLKKISWEISLHVEGDAWSFISKLKEMLIDVFKIKCGINES